MGLYKQWNDLISSTENRKDYEKLWKDYLEAEKNIYENILENRRAVIEGTIKDLAEEFNTDPVTFMGFLDGINTSLINELDLESLEEESSIKLEIDFEKLYYNMLAAKANWLYKIEAWDNILTQEKRTEITKNYKKSIIAVSNKVGRNDPCTCGSGKKYKKCCGK